MSTVVTGGHLTMLSLIRDWFFRPYMQNAYGISEYTNIVYDVSGNSTVDPSLAKDFRRS